MTVTVVLLVVLLALTVAFAVAMYERARVLHVFNRRYDVMLRDQRQHEREILDRVMFVAGKPWKNTADREDTEPAAPEDGPVIVEDPAAGAFVGSPYFDDDAGGFDVDDLERDLATLDRADRMEFDTRGLETL